MDWSRLKPWLGTVARLVLGGIWIWASLSKLSSPRTFVQAVRAYDATPEWLSKAIGYGLPVLEFCVGVLLVLGVVVRLAAAVSSGLLVVFLIGLVQAAARSLQISCGCFGGGGQSAGTTYTWDIVRDLLLLIAAAYLVVWSFTRVSIESYLARHDEVELPSAKRMRTPEGRRKYESAVAQKQAEARSRTLYMNSAAGVLLAVIVLAGIGVQSGRAKISGSLTATHASASSGVVNGKKAAATVDVYEDFQCPHCLAFEQSVGAKLSADVTANLAQVRYHTMSFLDSASNGNRYSSRAANAALCASDVSVADFMKYHDVLYGKDAKGKQVQPAEGSSGRSNDDFDAYAKQIGLTGTPLGTFDNCVQTEQHKALVEAITEKASEAGVSSTPTVKVNGKTVSATLAAVDKAIAAADAKGPKPTPTPPSPSKSSTPATKPSSSASSKPKTKTSTSSSPTK